MQIEEGIAWHEKHGRERMCSKKGMKSKKGEKLNQTASTTTNKNGLRLVFFLVRAPTPSQRSSHTLKG